MRTLRTAAPFHIESLHERLFCAGGRLLSCAVSPLVCVSLQLFRPAKESIFLRRPMGIVAERKHHEHLFADGGGGSACGSHTNGCDARRFWQLVWRSFLFPFMKRHPSQPRPDWTQKVESIGLTYHSH